MSEAATVVLVLGWIYLTWKLEGAKEAIQELRAAQEELRASHAKLEAMIEPVSSAGEIPVAGAIRVPRFTVHLSAWGWNHLIHGRSTFPEAQRQVAVLPTCQASVFAGSTHCLSDARYGDPPPNCPDCVFAMGEAEKEAQTRRSAAPNTKANPTVHVRKFDVEVLYKHQLPSPEALNVAACGVPLGDSDVLGTSIDVRHLSKLPKIPVCSSCVALLAEAKRQPG